MELAVSSELQASSRGLAGSYLPLPQINVWSQRAFTLLLLHFVVACQALEEKDIEVHVREEIVIQSREHIWMLNCLQEGLTPLQLYRGRFSLLRLPSVLGHMDLLSLQCPPCKFLSKTLPCSAAFAQDCTWCPDGCLALAVPSLGCLLSPEHKVPWPAGLLVSFCPFTC